MSGWRREGRHITASPDLSTLFPASANLFATMANEINERGQISGMAIVLSGPLARDIHAFLATPVNESIGRSVAEVAPTHPKSNVPANVSKQMIQSRPNRPIAGLVPRRFAWVAPTQRARSRAPDPPNGPRDRCNWSGFTASKGMRSAGNLL